MLWSADFREEDHGGYVVEQQPQAGRVAGAALAHSERGPAHAKLHVTGGRCRFRGYNDLNAVRSGIVL